MIEFYPGESVPGDSIRGVDDWALEYMSKWYRGLESAAIPGFTYSHNTLQQEVLRRKREALMQVANEETANRTAETVERRKL